MNPQDCYVKYTNDETKATVVSFHRVWDKRLFIASRDKAARNHSNEDERGVVVESNLAEYLASRK